MHPCPCCANSMLRHTRRHEVYWFCRNCWQEMPAIESSPQLNSVSVSLEDRLTAAMTRSLAVV